MIQGVYRLLRAREGTPASFIRRATSLALQAWIGLDYAGTALFVSGAGCGAGPRRHSMQPLEQRFWFPNLSRESIDAPSKT